MSCKKKSWTNETRDYSPNISPTDYPSEKNLFQQFLLKFDVSIEWRLLFHPYDSLHDIDQFTQTVQHFWEGRSVKIDIFNFDIVRIFQLQSYARRKKYLEIYIFQSTSSRANSIFQSFKKGSEKELKRRRKAWKVGIFAPSPLESSIEN